MTTSVLNATDRPDIRSALEARLSGASRRPVISRIGELEYLAQADWHIAEVKSHIKRQRLRVEHALKTFLSSGISIKKGEKPVESMQDMRALIDERAGIFLGELLPFFQQIGIAE